MKSTSHERKYAVSIDHQSDDPADVELRAFLAKHENDLSDSSILHEFVELARKHGRVEEITDEDAKEVENGHKPGDLLGHVTGKFAVWPCAKCGCAVIPKTAHVGGYSYECHCGLKWITTRFNIDGKEEFPPIPRDELLPFIFTMEDRMRDWDSDTFPQYLTNGINEVWKREPLVDLLEAARYNWRDVWNKGRELTLLSQRNDPSDAEKLEELRETVVRQATDTANYLAMFCYLLAEESTKAESAKQ
jgi:hypothetical protein